MEVADITPITRTAWEELYDAIDSVSGDRAARAFSRDPRTCHIFLMHGLDSTDQNEQWKAIDQSVKYMKERTVTLANIIKSENVSILKLRDAVYSSTCFSLLMRATFHEDVEVEILKKDEKFTYQNTTKEQTSKVTLQSNIVLSVSSNNLLSSAILSNQMTPEKIPLLRSSATSEMVELC
jgi:hypothetical protein